MFEDAAKQNHELKSNEFIEPQQSRGTINTQAVTWQIKTSVNIMGVSNEQHIMILVVTFINIFNLCGKKRGIDKAMLEYYTFVYHKDEN